MTSSFNKPVPVWESREKNWELFTPEGCSVEFGPGPSWRVTDAHARPNPPSEQDESA